MFTITLPILKTADKADLSIYIRPRPQARNAICVMVVDDNVDAAQTAAMLLEAHGHTVSVAYSAASAPKRFTGLAPTAMALCCSAAHTCSRCRSDLATKRCQRKKPSRKLINF